MNKREISSIKNKFERLTLKIGRKRDELRTLEDDMKALLDDVTTAVEDLDFVIYDLKSAQTQFVSATDTLSHQV